jgi:hypothetical protein
MNKKSKNSIFERITTIENSKSITERVEFIEKVTPKPISFCFNKKYAVNNDIIPNDWIGRRVFYDVNAHEKKREDLKLRSGTSSKSVEPRSGVQSNKSVKLRSGTDRINKSNELRSGIPYKKPTDFVRKQPAVHDVILQP